MKNKNILIIALVTVLILMIPLIAMQFTDEVKWTAGDFMVMGMLLFGTGLAYELVRRKWKNRAYSAGAGVALGAGLLLVWVNLAVGLIGDEGNWVNLMYFGVAGVGVTGALIARFRPAGMARALFATALAQALVPVTALLAAKPLFSEPPGTAGIFAANALFVLLFTCSALLFLRASKTASNGKGAA